MNFYYKYKYNTNKNLYSAVIHKKRVRGANYCQTFILTNVLEKSLELFFILMKLTGQFVISWMLHNV